MAEFRELGFYTVDVDYLQFLNKNDSEVYYTESYRTAVKPFVGVIVGINGFQYFIPLTSAKEKHTKWKNVCDEHFIIYEVIENEDQVPGDVYKDFSDKQKMHILSVLDTKKMIPVPENSYARVEFNELEDFRYRDLFRKEYEFCLKIKNKIIKRVDKIYAKQKQSGVVCRAYCSFEVCENAMKEWNEEHINVEDNDDKSHT